MNLKRAIWVGVVMYILSFIIGIIPFLITGADPTQMSDPPTSFFVIGIIISIILSIIFSLVYFKGKKIHPSAKEGFYFGLTIIVVGFVLDAIIFFLSSLAVESEMDILSYYSNPLFWVALVLVIATTTIIGAMKGKK